MRTINKIDQSEINSIIAWDNLTRFAVLCDMGQLDLDVLQAEVEAEIQAQGDDKALVEFLCAASQFITHRKADL